MSYEPGTYVKDGVAPREAATAADAVALVFDGYKLEESSAEEAPAAPEQPSGEPDAVPPGNPSAGDGPTGETHKPAKPPKD